MAGLFAGIVGGAMAGFGKGLADQAEAAGLELREQRRLELSHRYRTAENEQADRLGRGRDALNHEQGKELAGIKHGYDIDTARVSDELAGKRDGRRMAHERQLASENEERAIRREERAHGRALTLEEIRAVREEERDKRRDEAQAERDERLFGHTMKRDEVQGDRQDQRDGKGHERTLERDRLTGDRQDQRDQRNADRQDARDGKNHERTLERDGIQHGRTIEGKRLDADLRAALDQLDHEQARQLAGEAEKRAIASEERALGRTLNAEERAKVTEREREDRTEARAILAEGRKAAATEKAADADHQRGLIRDGIKDDRADKRQDAGHKNALDRIDHEYRNRGLLAQGKSIADAESGVMSAAEKRTVETHKAKNTRNRNTDLVGTFSDLRAENYELAMKWLGGEDGAAMKALQLRAESTAEKEAAAKAGLWSSDKTDFGGSREQWIKDKARALLDDWLSPPAGKTPAPAPSVQASAPAPAAAKAEPAAGKDAEIPPAPPVAERVAGQKYRGAGDKVATWTGKGWKLD